MRAAGASGISPSASGGHDDPCRTPADHSGSGMYAIIKSGGKQYRVAENDLLTLEKLPDDAGQTVELAEVLMVGGEGGVQVGAPFVEGARVTAEVVEHSRAKKIIVFKKRRRKHYRRRAGHRQHQTVVRITGIIGGVA
jgi:large subunit ribosomal protein L21